MNSRVLFENETTASAGRSRSPDTSRQCAGALPAEERADDPDIEPEAAGEPG